jgi:hypothetical protein
MLRYRTPREPWKPARRGLAVATAAVVVKAVEVHPLQHPRVDLVVAMEEAAAGLAVETPTLRRPREVEVVLLLLLRNLHPLRHPPAVAASVAMVVAVTIVGKVEAALSSVAMVVAAPLLRRLRRKVAAVTVVVKEAASGALLRLLRLQRAAAMVAAVVMAVAL